MEKTVEKINGLLELGGYCGLVIIGDPKSGEVQIGVTATAEQAGELIINLATTLEEYFATEIEDMRDGAERMMKVIEGNEPDEGD